MGCGTSKNKSLTKNQLDLSFRKNLDIYDRILNSEVPIQIDSIENNKNINIETPDSEFKSKYLVTSQQIASPITIIDTSAGYPLVFNIITQQYESINMPVSNYCRCISLSNNKILITSQQSSIILEMPSLKKTPVGNMLISRLNHSLVCFNDQILATGGENSQELASCEIFDGIKWENISSLNLSRSWHSSICYMDTVYVIGGLKTNTIEKLKGKWEVLPIKLPWNINRIGVAPINNNRILIVGGEIIGEGYSKATWEFDIKNLKLFSTKKCPVQGLFYSQGGYYENSGILMSSGMQIIYHETYKDWNIIIK